MGISGRQANQLMDFGRNAELDVDEKSATLF